jgi:predicted glutamine amidotransferase
MCRWVAYRGRPVFMDEVVTKPCHSLIRQSVQATQAKTGTNGDGFGVGWYGDRPTPGLYRELRPAWSDDNLLSLCEQVQSRMFFAHVRASTGTATSRANCHPFAHGRHLFMHNGQVGCYATLRRRIEAMVPDALYDARTGTTDSEAIFLACLGQAENNNQLDAVSAMAKVLGKVSAMMKACDVCEPLRFTAALTDGQTLHAYRWASDDKAPTLYFRERDDELVVVSEPLDDAVNSWIPVPQAHVLIAQEGKPCRVEPFKVAG